MLIKFGDGIKLGRSVMCWKFIRNLQIEEMVKKKKKKKVNKENRIF